MSIVYCPECETACRETDDQCPACKHRLRDPAPPPPDADDILLPHVKEEVDRVGEEDPTLARTQREIGILQLLGVCIRVLGLIVVAGGLLLALEENAPQVFWVGLGIGLGAVIFGTLLIALAGMWGALEKILRKGA